MDQFTLMNHLQLYKHTITHTLIYIHTHLLFANLFPWHIPPFTRLLAPAKRNVVVDNVLLWWPVTSGHSRTLTCVWNKLPLSLWLDNICSFWKCPHKAILYLSLWLDNTHFFHKPVCASTSNLIRPLYSGDSPYAPEIFVASQELFLAPPKILYTLNIPSYIPLIYP